MNLVEICTVIIMLCFRTDAVSQGNVPAVTAAAVTTTSSETVSAPEPSTEKTPAPQENLDEVDMFSQALMQLTETNKQVSTTCMIIHCCVFAFTFICSLMAQVFWSGQMCFNLVVFETSQTKTYSEHCHLRPTFLFQEF